VLLRSSDHYAKLPPHHDDFKKQIYKYKH
jgi:hypothetical protein